MNIIFKVENHTLAEDFKEIVLPRLESLNKLNGKLSDITVEVNFNGKNKIKKENHEVRIKVNRPKIYIGEGRGKNDLEAFDKAIKKLESQLRKENSKKGER